MTYTTVGRPAQRVSQRAFLRLLTRASRTSSKRPRCGTWTSGRPSHRPSSRIARLPGAYHRMRFARADGGAIEIDTTRPELLPACVALVAHPDDARFQPLFGTEVADAAVQGAACR